LGNEILSRSSWSEPLDKQQVLGSLVAIEQDTGRAIALIDQGRNLAKAAHQSCARWDLEELSLRLEQFDVEPASRLVAHIQQVHRNEPGVSRALTELLIDAGVLRSDGTPAAMQSA